MIVELDNDVQNQAFSAYYSGRYFEAIQLIHGNLESAVRMLLFSSGPKIEFKDYIHIQHVSEEITLSQGIKSLYVIGVISKSHYDRAVEFNRLRNKLIHEFHSMKALKVKASIEESKLESVFRSAADLSNEFIELSANSNTREINCNLGKT